MKVRLGFVSNSSSSSFVIAKVFLTADQAYKIRNHSKFGKEMGMDYTEDTWYIDEDEGTINGCTTMDNFDMATFLENIGVNMEKVHWGCGY